MNIAKSTCVFCSIVSTTLGGQSLAQSPLDVQISPMLGTISTQFEPLLSNGKLNGCTMVFTAIIADYKYELGTYLKIEGNFGFLSAENGIGSNLKVVVNKIGEAGNGYYLTPKRPSRAYLVSKDLTTSVEATVNTFEGDTPGSVFVVFDAVRGIQFATEMLLEEKIGIAFNQGMAEFDMLLSIDFGVIGTDSKGNRYRSRKTLDGFSSCLNEVTKTLQ